MYSKTMTYKEAVDSLSEIINDLIKREDERLILYSDDGSVIDFLSKIRNICTTLHTLLDLGK